MRSNWTTNFRTATGLTALALALSACGVTPEQERAEIERTLVEDSEGAELFAVIQKEYPDDLNALLDQLQDVDPTNRNEARGKEIGAAWLQDFMTRIGPDAVKAPADALLVWSATEAELYETLQRGAESECATMTMGGWVMVEGSNTVVQSAIQRRNTAMVKAAAAGRDDPQEYSEPSQDQLDRLSDAIAATGIDPNVQAVIGSIPDMQALPIPEQCQIGVAFYQGITDLPDDIEPTVAAYMLSPE